MDAAGNVIVAEADGLRLIPERSGHFYGVRSVLAGDIYAISGPAFSGDSEPAAQAEFDVGQLNRAGTEAPLARDSAGDLFVINQNEVRMIPAVSRTVFGEQERAGHVYRIAGQGLDFASTPPTSGGQALSATLGDPAGIGTDTHGNLIIADTGSSLVRVVAAQSGTFYGQHMTEGHIYTVAGGGSETTTGGLATDAQLTDPVAVATDHSGTLLISVRCQILALPTATGTQYGQPMTAGHLYAIAGSSTCTSPGTGGPAADLAGTGSLTVDAAGNVLNGTGGGIVAIAASTGTFYGQPMTAGDAYLVAPPIVDNTNAFGIDFTVDHWGNLVETNPSPESVSVIAESNGSFYGTPMTAGHTYQIGGDGQMGHSGLGGPAIKAPLDDVGGVVATPAGDLIITEDHWLSRISG